MTTMVSEGVAVSTRDVAEGIAIVDDRFFDGGYVLSGRRNALVHPAWRVDSGVYLSVGETAAVVVTFVDVFSADIVQEYAHHNARWGLPQQYAEVFGEFAQREARGTCSECGDGHRVWAGRSWMLCTNPAKRCNGSVDLTTLVVAYKPL